MIQCSDNPKDGYYLPWKKCNGFEDCFNGSDESFDECGAQICGETMTVTVSLKRLVTNLVVKK